LYMPGVSTTTLGSLTPGRRHRAQRLEQQVGIVRHRRDAVQREQLGKQPHRHLAVLEHVAHTAGHAQVVFQHVVGAAAVGVAGAHDVDAGDVRIDAAGHVHAHHLGPELRVLGHLLLRHDAGLDDLLPVVDVVDEAVERMDALAQPGFHLLPFAFGDDARDHVERNQPLGAGAVLVLGAVDGERDADSAEHQLGLVAPRLHRGRLLGVEPAAVGAVVQAHARGAVHLVEARLHGRFSPASAGEATSAPKATSAQCQ
jgi:hypothetical protein